MTKRVVSVQDISCFGQCSQTVALPILSAMGIETAILPSSILSTHTGCFKNFTVHDLTEELPKIVNHWIEENITFDAIYTGYIGDIRQFDTIKLLRRQLRPGGLFIVDPAMADLGELYSALDNNIIEGMRDIISYADVVIPNLTEAAFLTGAEYKENYTQEETEELMRRLSLLGPRYSVVTGISTEPGRIGAGCYDKETDSFTYYMAEFVDKVCYGTGDIFSSVIVGSLVNGSDIYSALKLAGDFTASSIRATLNDDNHYYGVNFESVLPELLKGR